MKEEPNGTCTAAHCSRPARMAIRTRRTKRENIENVVYADDRSAPAAASRYCKTHGLHVIHELICVLVDGDDDHDACA